MSKPKENSISLDKSLVIACPKCQGAMRKISWQITAAAADARLEVEQTVFKCPQDDTLVSIEVTTGNPSEFA